MVNLCSLSYVCPEATEILHKTRDSHRNKNNFIKLSQSGRRGGIFWKSILFTVRECIWENNADQVFFYQQLKVCVRISKGTDTHPHDSHTVGLCALTLTSCLLFSKPKQLAFPSGQLFPTTLTLKLLLILFLSSPSITAAKQRWTCVNALLFLSDTGLTRRRETWFCKTNWDLNCKKNKHLALPSAELITRCLHLPADRDITQLYMYLWC